MGDDLHRRIHALPPNQLRELVFKLLIRPKEVLDLEIWYVVWGVVLWILVEVVAVGTGLELA
jgi:hypothetical protein